MVPEGCAVLLQDGQTGHAQRWQSYNFSHVASDIETRGVSGRATACPNARAERGRAAISYLDCLEFCTLVGQAKWPGCSSTMHSALLLGGVQLGHLV